ncbi:MAG: hypothetical protein Q7U33_12005, partial [Methylotenera sp.]
MQFTTNEGYSDDVFKNCSSTPPASEWLKPVSLLQESEPPQYPLESLPSGLGDAVREVIEFV